MFCPQCGAGIPEGGKFCMACGYRLEPPKTDGSAWFFAPPSLTEEQPKPVQPPVEAPRSAPVVQEVPRYVPVQMPPQPRPVPPTVQSPASPAAPEKKKKKKWVLPLILIPVLLILAGGVAAVFLLGDAEIPIASEPEQIFLRTSVEIRDEKTGVHYVEKLDYEDDGTLNGFSLKIEDGNEFGYLTQREITYEYDGDLLEAVVIETGGETYEVELQYDDDVLESVSGSVPEGELTGDCDRDGRITEIEIRDESGETVRFIRYSYEDGMLEEKVETVGNYVYTYRYENGMETEVTLENGDEEVYRYVYVYNERGYLTEERRYENGELEYAVEFQCEYEDDLLISLVIVLEDSHGETEIEGEVEWDDEEAVITLSGRNTEGDRLSEDTYLELFYDEDGNLLRAVVVEDDELTKEYSYTYLEVEDPEEYVSVDPYDPRWLIQLG